MATKNNKRIKANLKLRVFLIFLTLSIVFWMLINLSKTYTTEVVFKVEYINLPIDRVFQTDVVKEVKASVNSTGFNLLKYKLNKRKLQLDVSNLAYKSGSKFYYLPNNHLTGLKLQLNNEISIERIYQDTIFVTLGLNMTKRIPVELNVDIQFMLGYNFVDIIKVTPDSIDITGPESALDTIYTIVSDMVKLVEVSANINEIVSLVPFENKALVINVSEVNLTAGVDKFTEGSLTVPFKIINLPEHYNITTFPKEIQIIYKVGLTNFSKITADNMNVFCDFKQSQDNKLNYLIPQLEGQSSLISSVRFVPNKIEYLIEQ